MRKPASRITLAVVLDHIKGLASSVHGLERRMVRQEQRMERMEQVMSTGFKALNRRLDDVEFEELPRRVSVLEDKVFAGIDPKRS